jgi:hypothetical protein
MKQEVQVKLLVVFKDIERIKGELEGAITLATSR